MAAVRVTRKIFQHRINVWMAFSSGPQRGWGVEKRTALYIYIQKRVGIIFPWRWQVLASVASSGPFERVDLGSGIELFRRKILPSSAILLECTDMIIDLSGGIVPAISIYLCWFWFARDGSGGGGSLYFFEGCDEYRLK